MIIESIVVSDFATNCYIAGCEETKEAIIIDAGDNHELILQTLKSLDLELKCIVSTHAHLDHAGGVKALQEATGKPFYINENEMPLLNNLINQAEIFNVKVSGIPKVDRYIKQGDKITFGRYSLKVLDTPGHTPGGICLLAEGIIFVGDTLFAGSIGRTDLFGGNFDQLMTSIKEQLMSLNDDIKVYPGHGPVTTIGDEREINPFCENFI